LVTKKKKKKKKKRFEDPWRYLVHSKICFGFLKNKNVSLENEKAWVPWKMEWKNDFPCLFMFQETYAFPFSKMIPLFYFLRNQNSFWNDQEIFINLRIFFFICRYPRYLYLFFINYIYIYFFVKKTIKITLKNKNSIIEKFLFWFFFRNLKFIYPNEIEC